MPIGSAHRKRMRQRPAKWISTAGKKCSGINPGSPSSYMNPKALDSVRGLPTILPGAARRLSLLRQGLWRRQTVRSRGRLLDVLRMLGIVQLDSIRTVERSHYLVLFSRVGHYDTKSLDQLLFPDQRIIEQWAHVASLMPIEDLQYYYPVSVARRKQQLSRGNTLALGPNPNKSLRKLLSAVEERGTVICRDIEGLTAGRGSEGWWTRSPTRMGLDVLFRRGHIFVEKRLPNYEKCFASAVMFLDEAQRGGLSKFTESEACEWTVLRTLTCLGAATMSDICDYYRLTIPQARGAVDSLMEKDLVRKAQIAGWNSPVFLRKSDLDMCNLNEVLMSEADITTFLSPFDNLIWSRDRMERLFGVRYRNQMYKRTEERNEGYYVMPILSRGNIVGMIDPKVERQTKTLQISRLDLQAKATVDPQPIAEALVSLARFTDCQYITFSTLVPLKIRRTFKRLCN